MSLMTEEEYAIDAGFECEHECPRCRESFMHDGWFGSGCLPEEADERLLCTSCQTDSEDCMSGCPNVRDDRKEHSFVCARANGY